MFRPMCHDVQLLMQQSFKVNKNILKNIIKRPLSLCTDCQSFQLPHRNIYKKLKSSSYLPLLNVTRVVSSDSQNGGEKQSKSKVGKPSLSGQSPSSGEDKSTTTGQTTEPKILKVTPRPRKTSLDYSYTGNIYILPFRAMSEYLLKPSDIDVLPKYSRRSPYEIGYKINLYLRTDVETVAKKIWGSLEKLEKEKDRRRKQDITPGKYDIFHVRSIIDEHKRSMAGEGINSDEQPYLNTTDSKTGGANSKPSYMDSFMSSGSGKVVLSAIAINGFNSLIKCIAWLYTGSHSMFSEFIHSVADTINQIILAIGLYHSIKKPDSDHPYGYTSLRHISSLISGVGIFCFGTGLSVYHGIQGFLHPEQFESLLWALGTLLGSLVSEGATLIVAVNQVRKGSKARKMKFWEYVSRGNDPNVTVVLLEDVAAVSGVTVAAICMGVTHYTGNPFADSLGSIIIGGILGAVASFIIYTNTTALVGRSIPMYVRHEISLDLERDRMIRSLHDIKATELGGQVRFKAEVDFDGREITRAYLYKLDLEQLLMEMRELQRVEDVEKLMLNHGEKIIDMLGEEVDRIEKILKTKHPELRHVDLEAL